MSEKTKLAPQDVARKIARSVRGCTTDAQYADLVVQIEDAIRDARDTTCLRAERPGWRTMESAPRFGHVILFDPKWGVCEGNRGDDGWALATFNGTIKQANPTLWQPLPDSPALHPSVAEGQPEIEKD